MSQPPPPPSPSHTNLIPGPPPPLGVSLVFSNSPPMARKEPFPRPAPIQMPHTPSLSSSHPTPKEITAAMRTPTPTATITRPMLRTEIPTVLASATLAAAMSTPTMATLSSLPTSLGPTKIEPRPSVTSSSSGMTSSSSGMTSNISANLKAEANKMDAGDKNALPKVEQSTSFTSKFVSNEPLFVQKKRSSLRKRKTFRHGKDKNCLWRRRWILMKTLEGDVPVLAWIRADEDMSDSDDDEQSSVPGNLGGTVKNTHHAPLIKQQLPKQKRPRVFQTSMHVCSECSKPFVEASALKKHMRTHGEKKHICQEPGCNKAFVESSKLKRHMMVHTGEKPFTCPYPTCGRDFGLDYNLRKHIQQMHVCDALVACPFRGCETKFTDENEKKAHYLAHAS